VTREATQSNPLYCLRVEAAPAATFSPTLEVDRVRSSFFSPRVRRTEDRKAFPSATRCRMCRRNLGNGGTRLEPVLRTKYVIQCGRPANFSNIFGGLPQMGTRLISGGGSPYTWTWSNTGSIEDYRSISYGAAQCMANSGNGYAVYVSFCWAANF
jgi:hypothetical protein